MDKIEKYRILKKKKGVYNGKKGEFLVREKIIETYLIEIEVCFTLEETTLLQVFKLMLYLTEKQRKEYKKGKLVFLKKLIKKYL